MCLIHCIRMLLKELAVQSVEPDKVPAAGRPEKLILKSLSYYNFYEENRFNLLC
jgi:hypothetical protein